ncbi:MAG: hypothetical protein GY942_04820, partial [Aestuariibacter sp.]|nr:hypothetical protein [Aestuariibacter sp.]
MKQSFKDRRIKRLGDMTYFNMKQLRLFFLTFAACLLAACGGLSKDAADDTFTVKAGRDRSTAAQSTTSLS